MRKLSKNITPAPVKKKKKSAKAVNIWIEPELLYEIDRMAKRCKLSRAAFMRMSAANQIRRAEKELNPYAR